MIRPVVGDWLENSSLGALPVEQGERGSLSYVAGAGVWTYEVPCDPLKPLDHLVATLGGGGNGETDAFCCHRLCEGVVSSHEASRPNVVETGGNRCFAGGDHRHADRAFRGASWSGHVNLDRRLRRVDERRLDQQRSRRRVHVRHRDGVDRRHSDDNDDRELRPLHKQHVREQRCGHEPERQHMAANGHAEHGPEPPGAELPGDRPARRR